MGKEKEWYKGGIKARDLPGRRECSGVGVGCSGKSKV